MKMVFASIVALASASCATIGVGPPQYNSEVRLSQAALLVLANGEAPAPGPNVPSDAVIIYSAMAGGKNASDDGVKRAVAHAMINNSDADCEAYMASTVTTSNTVSSSLGVSNLALTAAAGVTTPVENANLLSGIATFLAGTRTELTNTVLGGKTPDILYRAVMATRREERTRLLTLLSSGAPPEFVMGQISDYHSKCGIIVALNSLTEAVERTQANADQKGQEKAGEQAAGVSAAIEAARPQ